MLSASTVYVQPPIAEASQLLNIVLDKPSFFVDENITGKVEINTGAQIIINDINLYLNLLENWVASSEDDYDIGDTNKESVFSMSLD